MIMNNEIINRRLIGLSFIICQLIFGSMVLTGCSDEPDAENFYTFTGEMMSDYLKSPERPQYSEFAEIVERAGMMDLISTYGHYTCFVPSNDAVNAYLKEKGKSSVADLTDAECDTIARTHLVSNMYSTIEMTQDRLATSNMMGRYLSTSQGFDNDSNAVVYLEGVAHIYFNLKDDSVENGIVQPIDMVIEKSNSYISDIIRDVPSISIFYNALVATGVIEEILLVEDPDWNPKDHSKYYYRSHIRNEVAWVPDTKKYGYTIFVEPDSVYERHGITNLRQLYEKACEIYDKVYPEDINAPGHSFENLKDSVNPLHRFIQYHILNKYVAGTADLTPPDINLALGTTAFGVDETLINPVDWHYTLLPHTLMKVEKLTVKKYQGAGKIRERYINRRYDNSYQIEGQHIDPTIESDVIHDALNGHFFYVDDIVAFTDEVQNKVQNVRIRMDFSTIFPEIIGNGLRFEGNPMQDDNNDVPDDSSTPKNGRNFYFPLGYLDGVTFNTTCHFVLRRPHVEFWSWQGDELNLFGDYDFTFRLPPVPYSGDWQVRLGFAPLETRGVMQVYIDGVPQGIPLDMTQLLNDPMYLGDRFVDEMTPNNYDQMSDEEKAEEQKILRNLGACRSPRSLFYYNQAGSEKYCDAGNAHSYRRILCQAYIDNTSDHYIRFRVASDGKQGNNNEFMLDYLELVPKSVYGVDGEGQMEDDL